MLISPSLAYGARSRTYNIRYQETDYGRSQGDNTTRNEINTLSQENIVSDVPIPILFGVKVSDLEDTWGDARSEGRVHEGIDILVPRGSLIVSPTKAIITSINAGGNGGNYVFTANPGGERYYYAHLDSFAEGLEEGQVLEAGDLIGYVGNTGNASGGPTHLHFGIYQDDHNALNPFLLLTLEFSLQEKSEALEKILNDAPDSLLLARTLVGLYKNTFVEMNINNIKLPAKVIQVLTEIENKATEVLGITRTLRIGMQGDDVKFLQTVLGVSIDGSFGPKTKAALIAFQIKKGLSPDGVFGPKTRAVLAEGNLPAGCTKTTIYSILTGVKCSFAN